MGETMEMYINTLSGYIHDEDKLVTYKWLSKDLQVHVNTAKLILEEYWIKNKNTGIVATILIIGRLKKGGIQVEVVRETNLKGALEKYENNPSMHIYSLQKTLPDIQLLANSGQGDLKYSAITCKDCDVLTEEEIFARRWGSTIKFQAVEKPAPKNGNPVVETLAKEVVEPKTTPQGNSPKKISESSGKPNKISPPKGGKAQDKKGKNPIQTQKAGFNNLFGKVVAANQKKSPPTKDQNKTTPMEIDSPKKSEIKEITEKISSKSPENHSSFPEVENTSKKSSQIFSKSKTSQKETEKENSESQSSRVGGKTAAKVPKTRGKKRGGSQDIKNNSKKRKRIVVVDDSSGESDDSGSESKFADVSPPPEEENIPKQKSPSPPPVQQVNGKRKVRKLVDQTYMDEDGYLVTKKVHVYESCSEEDEPPAAVEVKKPAEAVKEPVKTGKKPNKQTTLMSFFKKA